MKEREKSLDRIKKEIEKLKNKVNDSNPFFHVICVEEHDSLREGLAQRLKDVSNSLKGFSIEFSLIKYNSQIPSEIVKNGGTDLVIIDLDQTFDLIDTVNQIRAFGWHIPLIFTSVEKIKASNSLLLVKKTDASFSEFKYNLNYSIVYSLDKLNEFINSNDKQFTPFERQIFPILDNLIYQAIDKQKLYLSQCSRIIINSILRAKEIKRKIDELIRNNRREDKSEK
ncbi:MAG: response regulator [Candidatus Micrarchaeota archaeon]|nr:response regulator [Candidatus Micrarchaeota archaeon]